MRYTLLICASLVGCSGSSRHSAFTDQAKSEKSWWEWHADKQSVGLAADEAINEPNGGDYAKAVTIIRASDWPEAVKDHQIGFLIIGSFRRKGSRRPPETLEQGLEMVERSATRPGETSEYAPQHLRLTFERGDGIAPNNIPIDLVVANCWHKLEIAGAGDPARCIALRRQRLPHVGQ